MNQGTDFKNGVGRNLSFPNTYNISRIIQREFKFREAWFLQIEVFNSIRRGNHINEKQSQPHQSSCTGIQNKAYSIVALVKETKHPG